MKRNERSRTISARRGGPSVRSILPERVHYLLPLPPKRNKTHSRNILCNPRRVPALRIRHTSVDREENPSLSFPPLTFLAVGKKEGSGSVLLSNVFVAFKLHGVLKEKAASPQAFAKLLSPLLHVGDEEGTAILENAYAHEQIETPYLQTSGTRKRGCGCGDVPSFPGPSPLFSRRRILLGV